MARLGQQPPLQFVQRLRGRLMLMIRSLVKMLILPTRSMKPKCLQDDRGSLQHNVHEVGPVLEQTTLKECASAAVFQPSVTSTPS